MGAMRIMRAVNAIYLSSFLNFFRVLIKSSGFKDSGSIQSGANGQCKEKPRDIHAVLLTRFLKSFYQLPV